MTGFCGKNDCPHGRTARAASLPKRMFGDGAPGPFCLRTERNANGQKARKRCAFNADTMPNTGAPPNRLFAVRACRRHGAEHAGRCARKADCACVRSGRQPTKQTVRFWLKRPEKVATEQKQGRTGQDFTISGVLQYKHRKRPAQAGGPRQKAQGIGIRGRAGEEKRIWKQNKQQPASTRWGRSAAGGMFPC